MPRHTRRKLAERSVVRAAMEDASDDEAAATNVPVGGMIPRSLPAFVGTGWSPSDIVFRSDFHLSQRPRAGLVSLVMCFEFVSCTCIGFELIRSSVGRWRAVSHLLVLGGASEGFSSHPC